MTEVLVIGGGVAGSAAALTAARHGANVTIVLGGAGASTLAPGALDDAPWDAPPSPRLTLDDDARAALLALDAFELPERGALLATTAGTVRPARGHDRSLLDLMSLRTARIFVPRLAHGSWDGVSLARAWNDAPAARERELSFVSAGAQLTRFVDERAMADAELAARHDHDERLGWLEGRLRIAMAEHGGTFGALLLPPWLGLARPRGPELARRLDMPCGEAMSGPGGPSGLRFEHARDRALAQANVASVAGRITRLTAVHEGFEATLEDVEGPALFAERVVFATGGLVGGGLVYTPAGSVLAAELPPGPRPILRLSIDAPLPLGVNGAPLATPSSLFGAPPESHAWPFAPLLERAGVLGDDDGAVPGAPGFYAAGEITADRPRTWLAALDAGARAGARAAAARAT